MTEGARVPSGPGAPAGAWHVYLAGPEVFLDDAAAIGRAKQDLCASHGLVGHFPLDDAPAAGLSGQELALAIFDVCVAMMERSDLAIVNMTPFRGVSMDVGSALEMGHVFASGKPVFGYTNDAADYCVRVEAAGRAEGAEIEDFGLADNLMCDGVVRRSGGVVVRRAVTAPSAADRLRDLEAFHECVHQALAVFRSGPALPRRRSG
jgi:nucleoside 2-deoxyribosyltransferase